MDLLFKDLLYFSTMFIGVLVGLVLIFYGIKKNRHNVLLGLVFFLLTYSSFIVWLIISKNHVFFPQLYRTGNLSGFLFIPLSFLYVRNTIKGKSLGIWDLIHLLPALVFMLDFVPVYMMDNAEKLAIIRTEVDDPSLFTRYSQSRFFPDNFYNFGRSFVFLGYWIASLYLLKNSWKTNPVNDFTKEWNVWIVIYLVLELIIFFPFLLVFWFVDPLTSFYLIHFSIILLNLGTAVSLLFFPKILYGLDLELYTNQLKKKESTAKTNLQENLSPNKVSEIDLKFGFVLDKEKRFLKHGYSIHNLAEDAGFPVYILTIYINKILGTTFPDLINKRRIEECCRMIESGKYAHLTVEGLADLCGFSNRNSFSLAFRKYQGIAPSDFIKSQKNVV